MFEWIQGQISDGREIITSPICSRRLGKSWAALLNTKIEVQNGMQRIVRDGWQIEVMQILLEDVVCRPYTTALLAELSPYLSKLE